jgi:hypothetical protein
METVKGQGHFFFLTNGVTISFTRRTLLHEINLYWMWQTNVCFKRSFFWGIVLYSPVKDYQHFEGMHETDSKHCDCCLFHAGFMLGLLLTLKVEVMVMCSSETLVDSHGLHSATSQRQNSS